MNHRSARVRLLAATCLAGASAFAFATGAWAQSDAAAVAGVDVVVTGGGSVPLSTVTATGSRLGISLQETPASVAIITGAQIQARGDLTVTEAVSRAVGISSSAQPGTGGTALNARGFSGQSSVLQMVDGVRLFPVAGTVTFPADPWNVERIEVLNGPASVLYGQGSLGAAVNVITKKPNTTQHEAEGRLSYGSQNSWQVAGGAGGPLGRLFAYRVDGSYRQSDGYVDRGDNDSLALSGAIRFAPTDRLIFNLRHDHGDNNPMIYYGTPLINGKLDTSIRKKNYNVLDADLHYRDNQTKLTMDWAITDQITFSNVVYKLRADRLFKGLRDYCAIGPTGVCPRGGGTGTPGLIYRSSNRGIVHDQRQWGDQANIKIATPLSATVKNTLVGGFDVNDIKLIYKHNFSSAPQVSLVNPSNFDPGLFLDTQGIAPRYRTWTKEHAFFAEDRLELGDQISLVASIRNEQITVYQKNIDAVGNVIPAELFRKKLENTTWRVGGVYEPTPNMSLYAQYTTGVDPLGTITTYSSAQVQYENATGTQVEVGAKYSFLGGRGAATLAAYRIVKKNLLSQQTPTSPVEQVGARSSQGIEASVSVTLPKGFGIDVNGTVLKSEFEDFRSGAINYTGNLPPNAPESTGNLWLSWSNDKADVRAGVRYVGRMFSDNANRFRIPSYTVVDATATYAINSHLAVDVRFYNLFNKDYAVNVWADEQWLLGRPRSVEVGLKARF